MNLVTAWLLHKIALCLAVSFWHLGIRLLALVGGSVGLPLHFASLTVSTRILPAATLVVQIEPYLFSQEMLPVRAKQLLDDRIHPDLSLHKMSDVQLLIHLLVAPLIVLVYGLAP